MPETTTNAPANAGAPILRRIPIGDSSTIKAVGYDPETCALEIDFLSGGRYRYAMVPGDVVARLLFSPSAGKAFALHVKGKYPFERLPAPEATP